MAYDIHVKFVDGGAQYNADHYRISENGLLTIQVSGDELRFSPNYWQAFVIDPSGDDPLDLMA